ncbi:MAG: hypothetical protein L0387_35000 [Acidobacteria bacterium]|nr:hypothetical protein [Acidobacteriota bacterium]
MRASYGTGVAHMIDVQSLPLFPVNRYCVGIIVALLPAHGFSKAWHYPDNLLPSPNPEGSVAVSPNFRESKPSL